MMTKITFIFFLCLTAVACSHSKHQLDSSEPFSVIHCRQLIHSLEQTISNAGVLDLQDRRIVDFPYLRINRLLSSFRDEAFDEKFVHWVELLRQKGVEGWLLELKNLPAQHKDELNKLADNYFPEKNTLESKFMACSQTLSQYDLQNEKLREKLRQNAVVPSAYNSWQQVLGIYPLIAIPFRIGIYQWHQETLEIFKKSQSSLPKKGKSILYTPNDSLRSLSRENVADILQKSANNALQIPIPTDKQQQELFNTFAPTFEINVNSENDRIGKPEWIDRNNITINTAKPVVYKHISHSRFFDTNLLQLNYIIWFPARPKTSRFDMLGGHLDGVIWRVTLNMNGVPLMFDSIHMCGCYHFFFPSRQLITKQANTWFTEPDFIPQGHLDFDSNKGRVIRISANQHYIQKVSSEVSTQHFIDYYQLKDADNLRSLALPDGQFRSIYEQDGFIRGSERSERYLFWPMGVPNAGAMRQWGHHATAFVGRRHFDDARLFEKSFEFDDSSRSK